MKRLAAPAVALLVFGSCTAPARVPAQSGPDRVPVRPHPQAPAAVRTLNVPEIEPELFESLDRYRSLRTASFADWLPDGRGLLVATRFGNTTQIHRVFEPGGRREQITFESEPVGGALTVPGTSARPSILFSTSRGGSENYQIHRLDLETLGVETLTDGRARHTGASVSRDGTWLAYSSNAENGRDMDLYLRPLARPEPTVKILPAKGASFAVADWSPDHSVLLVRQYVSVTESKLFLLNLETLERTEIRVPGVETVSFGGAAFGPDGGVYAAVDGGEEFRRLVRFDPGSGGMEVLTADIPWDVSGLDVHLAAGRLAFAANEDGMARLYLLDLKSGARRALDLPAGVASTPKFSPDGSRIAFTFERPNAPDEAYTLDVAGGGAPTRWTYSETAGLDPAQFVEPTLHHVASFDGERIPFYVWRSPRAGPRPVVLSIHGGPEGQSRLGFSATFQMWVRELGVTVVVPNVRGSTGYGRRFTTLDNGPKREDSARDVGAILDWIAAQEDLDASRVAVYGGSYGGYMVLACGVLFGERIRAIVDVVGISHFGTFLRKTSDYRRDLRRAEYGDERDPEMERIFEAISPLNRCESIRAALLVAHGENDPRVPVTEAEQLVRRVSAAGRPVWYVLADNEGHGFGKKENADFFAAAAVRFFREHLIGE